MAANFGIAATALWPWGGAAHPTRHDARQLIEVDLVRAMRSHPDSVAQLHAIYHATIQGVGAWTIDTTVPGGRVSVGLSGHPDCTFWTNQETLDDLLDHEVSPQWAVITGRLHVSNYGAAARLGRILQEAGVAIGDR